LKTETRVLLGVTVFFVVIGAAYAIVSNERAGSVMLAASAAMGLLASGSIWALSRHAPERAEDRADATTADGAGPVGVFALESVWPFVVGLGATVMMSGFAFGSWLVLIGAGAFVFGLVGFVAESRNAEVPDDQKRQSAPAPSSGTSST
jgi:hypothetical protein